jgi:hypothetical protein
LSPTRFSGRESNHRLEVKPLHPELTQSLGPLAAACARRHCFTFAPMKKVLGYSIGLLLVLLLALYVTLQFFLGGIVKSAVNKYGPAMAQTKIVLEDAKISPLSGVGTLSGLSVGNPPGWSQADAFRLGKVHIDMEPFSLLKDHIVINELVVEQPEFLYETKLVSSNIGDLLKRIEQAMGSSKDEPKTKDGKPIKLVVKKLVLKDGRVTLGVGGQAVAVPLPPIDMADIGVKEGGVTTAQLAVAIMRHVTPTIVAASVQALGKAGGTTGAAVEGAKQVGEALKGLFGGEKKK